MKLMDIMAFIGAIEVIAMILVFVIAAVVVIIENILKDRGKRDE